MKKRYIALSIIAMGAAALFGTKQTTKPITDPLENPVAYIQQHPEVRQHITEFDVHIAEQNYGIVANDLERVWRELGQSTHAAEIRQLTTALRELAHADSISQIAIRNLNHGAVGFTAANGARVREAAEAFNHFLKQSSELHPGAASHLVASQTLERAKLLASKIRELLQLHEQHVTNEPDVSWFRQRNRNQHRDLWTDALQKIQKFIVFVETHKPTH